MRGKETLCLWRDSTGLHGDMSNTEQKKETLVT